MIRSRRAIMQLLGLAPAAAMTGAAELAALVGSPAVKAAAAAGAMAALPSGLPGQRWGALGAVLGKQFERLRKEHSDEMWSRRYLRPQGGFDADIAALRSVSRVNKARQQAERDFEGDSLIRQAEALMYNE